MGIPETAEVDYRSPYALSKHFGETAGELYRKLYGLPTVSLRYYNVYGPRHQETGSYATVIAIFRKQLRTGVPLTIVGDGTQRRDFTFVGDVVRANMLAAMNPEAHGTYNIGTGKNYSINEVAQLVAPGHPTENVPPRLGEYRATLANNSRAKKELGWTPNISLEQGLKLTDQYENHVRPSMIVAAR